MEVPILNINDFVRDKATIGTRLVAQILRHYKHQDLEYACPKNETHKIYIEDITNYDDKFFSMEEDKKTHMMKLKLGNKPIMLCFPPRTDRVQVRTLQQKLADVTTNEIIRNLTDKQYKNIFAGFYKPMNRILIEYCRLKKLSPLTDIVLFYKGGNVFRILLTEITQMLKNDKYKNLMKRSDADFQIYINPDLENNDIIRKEVSLLVLYVLHYFRDYVRETKLLKFTRNVDALENIKNEYLKELNKNCLKVKHIYVDFSGKASRKDIKIGVGKINNTDDEFVMVRGYPSLVNGIDNHPTTYFISYNTALDFKRKDNLRATFDLLRFRRNFRLKVLLDTNEEIFVNVPFEIIDVSIPHSDDFGLKKLKNHITELTTTYMFKPETGNSFSFKAPTVKYQLKDLHDLLFYQNEYPWLDIKYEKRITRYFLSILLYDIVEGLSHPNNTVEIVLNNFYESFNIFRQYIDDCLKNGGSPPDFNITHIKTLYVRELYNEYILLHEKVLNSSNVDKEMTNLKQFLKTIKYMIKELLTEVLDLRNELNTGEAQTRIKHMYKTMFEHKQTRIIGG
jgi:hypothetical protein